MLSPELFAVSVWLSTAVFAAPAPVPDPDPQGVFNWHPDLYCPIVDSTEKIAGEPWQVGVSAKGGYEVAVNEEHSVGTSWEVGGDLGLSAKGVSSGISYSVSTSVTDTFGQSVAKECPEGPWTCSMVVIYSMIRVKGHLHHQDSEESCHTNRVYGSEGDEFSFLIPVTDDAGNSEFRPELCTCKNLKHWADDGHVARLCPDTCTPEE